MPLQEFCLAIFELLRGALEVWVPLRITPHNCPALRGAASCGHGSQRLQAGAGDDATAPAVLDIPSQAIKLCARLVCAQPTPHVPTSRAVAVYPHVPQSGRVPSGAV